MAVSRILSNPRLAPQVWTVICLDTGAHAPAAVPCGTATNTRKAPRLRGDRAGDPVPPVLSCTAWGFSCPLACARGGGLLPRLFTLTRRLAPEGGLFSVTLSVDRGFRIGLPRVLRGMLPCGVRTFLSARASQHKQSDRPPSPQNLNPIVPGARCDLDNPARR